MKKKSIGTVVIDDAITGPIEEFQEDDTGFYLSMTRWKRLKGRGPWWDATEAFRSQRVITIRTTIDGVTVEAVGRLTRYLFGDESVLEFYG
jgi:hypothetical protein